MSEELAGVKVVSVSPEEKRVLAARLKKRRVAKILCAVLIPVIVVTVFFSVILNAESLGVGEGNTDGAYGTVLADIPNITVANPRIIDIAMLGAHDANTFSLDISNGIDNKEGNDILKAIEPITAGFQYRMAVTQAVSPYRLLLQGARLLHFKYTYYDGEWYASHTIMGREFRLDVEDVLRFLDEHPGEVVLLFLQTTSLGEDQSLQTFHDWLAGVEYNGKNIYDYVHYDDVNVFGSMYSGGVNIWDLRYNDVTEGGKSAGVVLFDRRDDASMTEDDGYRSVYSSYFYDIDSNASHQWHSRMGSDVLIDEINDYYMELSATRVYRWRLRVNQTQASVSAAAASDVFEDIGAWSLLKFAEKHNVALLENENFDSWLKTMPVFQVDFANSDYGDFNRRVNEKIRARNEEIVRILLEEGATYEDLYR